MRHTISSPALFATTCLALLMCAGLPALQAAENDATCTVVKLANGLEVRGVVLEETKDTLLLRTWTGDKKIARHNIVDLRRNLTAQEREAILSSVSPTRDMEAQKARDAAVAADALKVETPLIDRRVPPAPRERFSGGTEPARTSMPPADVGNVRRGSAEERIVQGLNKRVTLELQDEKLVDAIEIVSALTGVNIIINPKVRELNPALSLNIKAMDAATALKWMTTLTSTYIELKDQALWLTDKPSLENDNEERNEILMMMAGNGVELTLMPPGPEPLTDADRAQIAQAIWEKTNPKPQDFPGPTFGIGEEPQDGGFGNPFAAVPGR